MQHQQHSQHSQHQQHPHKQDRRSHNPASSVHAPAKKGGAGGSYTWGDSMDVPADYQPVGQQGPKKVTTDAPPPAPAPTPAAEKPAAKPVSREQFPPLASKAAPEPKAPPQDARAKVYKLLAESALVQRLEVETRGIREKAMHYAAGVQERVNSTVGYVQEAASARVGSRIAALSATLQGAKAQTLQYAELARSSVTSNLVSIRDDGVKAWVSTTAQIASQRTQETLGSVRAIAGDAARRTQAKATEVATSARHLAADKSAQTTAAAAAGGAVALGAAGGATGLATGTVVGAAIGLVPALFTFGLSIPIGAAIGGGAGLVAGAATGTAVGAVGGGAAGYGAYSKREQIAGVATQTYAKVTDSAEYVKGRATTSVDFVREKACVVRARLVGGGTGGTEAKD